MLGKRVENSPLELKNILMILTKLVTLSVLLRVIGWKDMISPGIMFLFWMKNRFTGEESSRRCSIFRDKKIDLMYRMTRTP